MSTLRLARPLIRPTHSWSLATVGLGNNARNVASFAVRRNYSSTTEPNESNNTGPKEKSSKLGLTFSIVLGVSAVVGSTYYFLNRDPDTKAILEKYVQKPLNYQKVYNSIADLLESNTDYDDGSYGPVLVRLAWHASGTYDKVSNTGGSNGATMRFEPESNHAANAGLQVARNLLEKVKAQFPEISYADLYTLGGVVAIQEMGGPLIPWRPGRKDLELKDLTVSDNVRPDGRLPDASQGKKHLRDIFYRMGFNDQEIVALSGAHVLGRCHSDRSGYDGPWSFSPTSFTNEFYVRLLQDTWKQRNWKGPKQYQDKQTKSLMMLPTDMSLLDKEFKPYVEKYAKDQDAFFHDFSNVFSRLLELGVPFDGNVPQVVFKPTFAEEPPKHPSAKTYSPELQFSLHK